ncbi:MAG: hypothetical protein ACLP00_12150 [Terracidiphilus sp.]
MIIVTALWMCAAAIALAQKPAASKAAPVPAMASPIQNPPLFGFTTVNQLRATPNSIPFTANNPGGTVAGGSLATINWNITQGRNGQTWTLLVGTASSSIDGCTTVPVSAITLRCISASVEDGGQASAGCTMASSTPLPNTLPGLAVASGNEGNSSSHNFTVLVSYQLSDSWRYIANTCPLNVSYTVITQ